MLVYLPFVFFQSLFRLFSCIILKGGQNVLDIAGRIVFPGTNLCIHWVKCLHVKILTKNVKGFAIYSFHKSITVISGCFGDPIAELSKNVTIQSLLPVHSVHKPMSKSSSVIQ